MSDEELVNEIHSVCVSAAGNDDYEFAARRIKRLVNHNLQATADHYRGETTRLHQQVKREHDSALELHRSGTILHEENERLTEQARVALALNTASSAEIEVVVDSLKILNNDVARMLPHEHRGVVQHVHKQIETLIEQFARFAGLHVEGTQPIHLNSRSIAHEPTAQSRRLGSWVGL